ncbi:unnamed protein product [Closterium sp. NIES-65]|nr:unnamed protein product [Closterium sp. NIES-65]
MASPSVLTFDAEGRAVDFEVWVDDLQLFLHCDRADGLSLFDLTSGASPAPAADANATVRSQWATRDAAARLAVRRHLPTTERAHFSQYKSAQTLYDAVVARYSSPATAALSRLMLPFLFPDLAAFPTIADLITHLRTLDTRYHAALPAEGVLPPPSCPLSPLLLRPTLLVLSRSALRLSRVEDAALARARGARALEGVEGAVEVVVEALEGVGVVVGVVSGVVVAAAAVEAAEAVEVAEGAEAAEVVEEAEVEEAAEAAEAAVAAAVAAVVVRVATLHRGVAPVVVRQQQQRSGVTMSPQQLREWYTARQRGGLVPTPTFSVPATALFPDASEIPRWGGLAKARVAIFDLDFDAILDAMYAVANSVEGAYYLYVPHDPGIEAAALGAGETAALGASASAAPGAGESALSGTASAQALHTFTIDSGASRSFIRDRTTLTPLSRPVAVSLADPSGGPVLASFSTVLPCPTAPSGTLSGLYLTLFSTNLVSGADLQDRGVDQFTPASQRVTHCTCARTGRHLATFSRQPGSSVYTLTTASPPPAASAQVATLSFGTTVLVTLPCLVSEAWPPVSLSLVFLGLSLPFLRGPTLPASPALRGDSAPPLTPPTEAPLQTLHMDVWGPARVSGQGRERYFLLVVIDYSRYTIVFPLRSKGDVTEYAAHQLNLQPRISIPETSHALRWTGKVGDASTFRRFYHPTSRRVLSSQDVTFEESVPYYRLFPYRTAPLPPPPLFLAPGATQVDLLPPQGPAPSGVSQVDAVEPVEVAFDSGVARGAEPAGAGSAGAGSRGAEPRGAETGGAETGGAEPGGAASGGAGTGGAEPGGAEPGGAGSACVAAGGASSRWEPLSPQELREWFIRRWRRAAESGGAAGATRLGPTGAAVGAGAAGGGAAGGVGAGVSTGAGASGGAAEAAGAEVSTGVGAAEGVGAGGAAGAGASEGPGVGAVGAGGSASAGAATWGPGAVLAGSGGAARPRPYFVPLLEQVLGLPPSTGPAPPLECPQPVQSQSQLQPASPLPAPSPYTGPTGGLAERREPASRLASPVCAARTSGRTARPRPPALRGTHQMALRPSTAPLRVPLPSPPESSLPSLADPESDSLRAASPSVTRLLATVVTDPTFESIAMSALVAELVVFAARCRLDYAASLVAASASVCPPSVGGECALSTDVLEDRQEEL